MASGNEAGRRGALILMVGYPGSGKTTLGQILAALQEMAHLESDAVRRELFSSPLYTRRESGVVFRELERRASSALSGGRDVIIDATNLRKEHRDRFSALAARMAAKVVVVRCTAPEETVRQRLALQRQGFSQADVAVYEEMRGSLERPREVALVVDSRFGLEAALHAIARVLEESP
jgi:predicted kinase